MTTLTTSMAESAAEPVDATEFHQARDWREHFPGRLSGRGLEIGPLHRPMIRHPGMDVVYVDRCTARELRRHYPELADLPLIEPNLLGDAETLRRVPNAEYDFLIAAHVIEHMRDPIGALEHWCRVVKPGGRIYLIVPHKRATFDRKRPRTTLPHLILDHRQPSTARDFEHFLEFAIHHDGKEGEAAIAQAKRRMAADYSIHFHVFVPSDVVQLLNWFSANVRPIRILDGPAMAPRSDEFHLLLEVGPSRKRPRSLVIELFDRHLRWFYGRTTDLLRRKLPRLLDRFRRH